MPSFVESLESRRLFAAGSLDITYGLATGVGKDVLPVGNLVVNDTALQPGDRMLVGGTFQPAGGTAQNFLVRYTADGKRDTTFAGTSLVIGNPAGLDSIDLMATQSNGGILLLDRDKGAFQLFRLTPDGKLDTKFGKSGVAKISFATARDITVGDDGKIVVVGDNASKINIARLTANGKLDTTFGGAGVVSSQLNLAGTNSEEVTYTRTASFATETPSGQVVIGGTSTLKETNPDTMFSRPFITRLSAAGKLDKSLDSDGTVQITSQGDSTLAGATVLSSGKMVIATQADASSSLLRLNADGSADTKFGIGGVTSLGGVVKTLAMQQDGKLLVCEPSELVRYGDDGSLDATFTDGNPGSGEDLVGLGSDGSILEFSAGHKTVTGGQQVTIRPSRRWSELAPAGLLATADLTSATTAPYRFSIQWRAEAGVQTSSLANSSIQIVGPNGATYKASFLGTTKPGNGIQRTANYKLAAPGGSWDKSDNGIYTIRLIGGVVKDTQGNTASKLTLGTFGVQIA